MVSLFHIVECKCHSPQVMFVLCVYRFQSILICSRFSAEFSARISAFRPGNGGNLNFKAFATHRDRLICVWELRETLRFCHPASNRELSKTQRQPTCLAMRRASITSGCANLFVGSRQHHKAFCINCRVSNFKDCCWVNNFEISRQYTSRNYFDMPFREDSRIRFTAE